VNVLASDQQPVCPAFAVTGGDKFGGLGWRPASSGAPIREDVVARVDRDIDAVHGAGDHDIVLGRVRSLDVGRPATPLRFFYGAFAPALLAPDA
jgi:flavin reductase (DIM6/NTAB) family NADH-FMN oxidoreductase RutF